jgi:hypothetical protein
MIRGMNRCVICVCCLTALTAPVLHAADKLFDKKKLQAESREALSKEGDFPFTKAELHGLIREVAAKIEEKFHESHPEADGLVQRVEESLAAAQPAKPAEDDRRQMLAQKMFLMNATANFGSEIGGPRGVVFDTSKTGYMQSYQDLEPVTLSDAADVWRWLEMADAAKHLKWNDKEEYCTQRALGAARGLVSRKPRDAEAHALLSLALNWGVEKLSVLQTALKLDPKQPMALCEMLVRRIDQAFEKAALRREIGMEEPFLATRTIAQALFDRPLSEEESLEFERQQDVLRRDAMRLLTLAQERGDLTVYLFTLEQLSELPLHADIAARMAKHGPDENFETFWAGMRDLSTDSLFRLLEDDELLRPALSLAAHDPEAIGTIMMVSLMGSAVLAKSAQMPPKESRMDLIRQSFTRLLVMAEADDTLKAARAAEAVFVMEVSLTRVMDRKPQHLDLLLRAVHLDPFRQRTQHMVMGMCAGMISKTEDAPAAFALAQTELALLPNQLTRRTCAAAATKLHDWPAAHRHLDACLKEKPDDLGLLNQKAVIFLRESQSKAAQKKAEFYFNKIQTLREKPDIQADEDDLRLITRNHILFLMMGGKNDAAHDELAKVKREKMLDDKKCEELEKLLP